MSLKVYRAYKLRQPQKLWETVTDIRKMGTEAVRSRLTELYREWMQNVDTKSEKYLKAMALHSSTDAARRDFLARKEVVRTTFREGYKAASVSMMADLFDFDVSVTFRSWNGQIYIIPYCSGLLRNTLDFLDQDPKKFKEYHYQNQSDPPPVTEVSRREWLERKAVWTYLSDHTRWDDFLALEICSWSGWHAIDPGFQLLPGR